MTTKEPGRRGLRVMIVEDEEAVRDVFRDFLAGLGHESIAVATAEDALEKLVGEQPDAILLDIRLPGMSDLDFLELPAVQQSGVPIFAVFGVATQPQARQSLKRLALDFILKPVLLHLPMPVLAYAEPFALARLQETP